MKAIDRSGRCWTCGRPRGLEQQRPRFGLHPKPYVPRTDDVDDRPAQYANDLICSVSVYRNGGTNETTHAASLMSLGNGRIYSILPVGRSLSTTTKETP